MNKIAIYTCIIGDYDNLVQPIVIDATFDYILFVKRGTKRIAQNGVWQIRELDFNTDDNTITSRYPKMNPHLVLPEYDYTLWMDGNLVIQSEEFYKVVNEKIVQGVAYSGIKHPMFDCVYLDMEACSHTKRDKFCNIFRAMHFLFGEKFPAHYGMYENNIILRNHHDANVKSFCEMWWKLYNKYPRRDQFTAPFCMRANHLTFNYLFPDGMSAKNSLWIQYIEHQVPAKSKWRYWYDYFAIRLRTHILLAYKRIHGVD